MADPKVVFKRSSVPGKIPNETQVPLGEIALNTYDGKVFSSRNVGIGTTVFVVNPWTVGTGTDTYNTYFTAGSVGIATTNPTSKLHVVGDSLVTGILTASGGFNIGIQSGGINVTTGVITALNFVGSGNTFIYNPSTKTVDISISGAGAGVSALTSADNYILTLSPSFNGITTAFTMQYNGTNYRPLNEQQLLVSLGGVIQEPNVAYNINDTTLTFSSAPNTETDYFIIALNTAALSRNRQSYNVTGVQTNFTLTNGYTVGYVDVYLNGSRLVVNDDYTATDGSIVGLTSAAQNGDIVEIVGYKAVALVTDDLVINGSLSVSGITTLGGGSVTIGSGSTALYVNGSTNIVGTVTATAFVGDGSGLTNISASKWVSTSAGIHTLSNVGIGTTDPTSKLTVQGNVLVSGVVTATSFVGDGSGLTNISASKWVSTTVGIHTLANVGIGTTNPTSKLTVNGDVNLIDGLFMMDSEINSNITVPTGKNALMIGPTTIGVGYTVSVESNATLVVI
jgi:hypothetical protein